MNKAVYLAGPISGLDYNSARFGWRKELADLLEPGVGVLSPMRHEGHLAEIEGPLANHYPSHLFSHAKMIVAKDFLDIDMSAIVVANLLGATKTSIGTLVEIGYAKAKGKTIVVMMEKGALHEHPFVSECASVVTDNLHDTAAIVNSLLSEGV